MIGKLCLLAVLYVSAISANPLLGQGNEMSSAHNSKCRFGGITVAEDVTEFESLFRSHLDGSEDLSDCVGASITNVWCSGMNCAAKINCNDNDKYAHFEVKRFKANEDLTEAVQAATDGMMPGGYHPLGESEGQILGYMEHHAGDCTVTKSECKYQMVQGKNYYCPAVCDDGTVRHLSVSQPLTPPSVVLKEVSDDGDCFEKLSVSALTDVVMTSSENTFIFLEDHCNFPKDTKDTLTVEEGSYVDLLTGIQHCITVSDDDKTVTLAIYKYNQPRTMPFLVAHPFEQKKDCQDFILQIGRMWANKVKQMTKMQGRPE